MTSSLRDTGTTSLKRTCTSACLVTSPGLYRIGLSSECSSFFCNKNYKFINSFHNRILETKNVLRLVSLRHFSPKGPVPTCGSAGYAL